MRNVWQNKSLACPSNSFKHTSPHLQRPRNLTVHAAGKSKYGTRGSQQGCKTDHHNAYGAKRALGLKPASDELACTHFEGCPGCSLQQQLHDPPIVSKAQAFFASRGFADFRRVPGPVQGWRCRAKLAVRGSSAAPELGLFQLGSHSVVAIPECRAHHPRINQAAQLVRQVAAALRIAPYAEPQQQQQQQQKQAPFSGRQTAANAHGKSTGSSSRHGGYLRYIQATVLPSKPGGRAEDDPAAAAVQLVLVWAASDASHPSVADAQRLAAALWSQAGPKQTNTLQLLRARAAAAAAAASNGSSSANNKQQQQKQRRISTCSSVSSSNAVPAAPLLHSIWLNFQPDEGSNRILGSSWQLLHGQQWGWQEFGGVPVAVAPGSFVQANYGAMQRCLAAIAAWTPPAASVVELYAGCGVIGLSLAARGAARRVVCVEVNPDSGEAFRVTQQALAASNPAAAAAVSHHIASAGDPAALQQLLLGSDADVLLVDPPRRGLDPELLQLLTAGGSRSRAGTVGSSCREEGGSSSGGGGGVNDHPVAQQQQQSLLPHLQRLIYLSCGFPALMADTDALLAAGWRLASCEAFLFFPGTDSIETLAVFDRQTGGNE